MQELFPLLARYGAKTYNGPLKAFHFGELGQVAPQIESDLFTRLFQNLPSDDYVKFMDECPTIEMDDTDSFYHWRVAGNNNKNIPLVDWEDSLGAKPTLVGQNSTFWYMYFNEGYFSVNDFIVGHNTDDYAIRVVAVESLSNNTWKYTVQLNSNDPANKAVPASEMTIGNRWSKDYNAQSSIASYTGTEAHFTTFVELKARLALQRYYYKIDGNVIQKGQNTPLIMGFPDPTDPTNPKAMKGAFVNFYDAVMKYQFRQHMARMFLYSHHNYTPSEQYFASDANNGNTIETFAGFFKQIANTNIQPYSTLNLDKIVDMTIEMGLAYKQDDQYYVELETGARGAQEISKWIESRSSQYVPNFDSTRVEKNQDMGGSGRTLTGVFSKFKSYNGVNIAVKRRPFFDDTERNKVKNPNGFGLISSHNILVRDWVGEAGVYKLKAKSSPYGITRYLPGMRDPFSQGGMGMSKPGMAVSKVDGYEVCHMDYIGCVIKDPTKVLYMPYFTV